MTCMFGRSSMFVGGVFAVLLSGVALAADIGGGGGGGGTAQGLDANFDIQNEIDNATSARPVIIGNGTQKGKHYGDATEGYVVEPVPLGDSVWRCWTNFDCVIKDMEGDTVIFRVDPDATTNKTRWQITLTKSFFIPASYFSVDGTNCVAPADATPVASGAKMPTILCADNDGSRMHATFDMPDDYDGGTFQLKSSVVQTAADTGVIEFQSRAQCKGDTETLVAVTSFGTEVVWTDTMTGSGAVNKATSGAITPSGTCDAGDLISLVVDIGATNTTTAMATAHILGFKFIYTATSLSH